LRERAEFFDTRVAGRQEIWQALRAALELMWEADTLARDARVRDDDEPAAGERDRAAALDTAQTILEAAEITLPTGDLANGAYDKFGNYYALPEHIVSDPINISLLGEDEGRYGDAKGDLTGGEDTAEEELGDDDEEEAARRREEKGKAVVDMRDQVPLRARLSEGDTDVTLSVGRGESVRSIARRVAEEALVCFTPFSLASEGVTASSQHPQLPTTKKIRIAYMGKILREGSSLLSQGWKQGHVVNALVFSR
jgi:hypothetical protein